MILIGAVYANSVSLSGFSWTLATRSPQFDSGDVRDNIFEA